MRVGWGWVRRGGGMKVGWGKKGWRSEGGVG